MKSIRILSVLLVVIAISLEAQNRWTIDPVHSNINFTIAHMVISEVTGSFKEFSGTMESSEDDFSDMKLTVNIKANSIDTDNEKRDTHLRGNDFFYTEKYNDIVFKSTKVEKYYNLKYKVHGDLTMRGITKEVVLDAVYKGKVKGTMGLIAVFKATTSINRIEWGMQWNKTIETGGLLAGEIVTLNINVEFVQE